MVGDSLYRVGWRYSVSLPCCGRLALLRSWPTALAWIKEKGLALCFFISQLSKLTVVCARRVGAAPKVLPPRYFEMKRTLSPFSSSGCWSSSHAPLLSPTPTGTHAHRRILKQQQQYDTNQTSNDHFVFPFDLNR